MIRRTLVLAAVLGLWLPATALAEMAGVTRSKLPNGMTVIVRENPAAPIVAIPAQGGLHHNYRRAA